MPRGFGIGSQARFGEPPGAARPAEFANAADALARDVHSDRMEYVLLVLLHMLEENSTLLLEHEATGRPPA